MMHDEYIITFENNNSPVSKETIIYTIPHFNFPKELYIKKQTSVNTGSHLHATSFSKKLTEDQIKQFEFLLRVYGNPSKWNDKPKMLFKMMFDFTR